MVAGAAISLATNSPLTKVTREVAAVISQATANLVNKAIANQAVVSAHLATVLLVRGAVAGVALAIQVVVADAAHASFLNS